VLRRSNAKRCDIPREPPDPFFHCLPNTYNKAAQFCIGMLSSQSLRQAGIEVVIMFRLIAFRKGTAPSFPRLAEKQPQFDSRTCSYLSPSAASTHRTHLACLPGSDQSKARRQQRKYNATVSLTGGIGFISHLLTYDTVGGLIYGKRPLLPTQTLTHAWLDTLWAALSFVGNVRVATFYY
jgi:hypothetical protein